MLCLVQGRLTNVRPAYLHEQARIAATSVFSSLCFSPYEFLSMTKLHICDRLLSYQCFDALNPFVKPRTVLTNSVNPCSLADNRTMQFLVKGRKQSLEPARWACFKIIIDVFHMTSFCDNLGQLGRKIRRPKFFRCCIGVTEQ